MGSYGPVLWRGHEGPRSSGIGILCIHGATFIVAMLVFWVLNMFGRLRISKEGELEGLDLHEHGIPAYPEYVISALALARGMPGRTS